jgi:peptide/nickel transport system substrate-binding protein
VGLALAGGGPLGGIYEVGVLLALTDSLEGIDFNDLEKNVATGRDFVRLHLQDMPNIPVMSYNVFSAMSERYWTGYPTSENPYTDPVNNWANSRYIFTQISPVGT